MNYPKVKGTLPNGKWAHRDPTPHERKARAALDPWVRGERRMTKDGPVRITLGECLDKLYPKRKKEQK